MQINKFASVLFTKARTNGLTASRGRQTGHVQALYNIEGKITDCFLVETGHFFLIFFRTRAKLLIPDWSSAKITRI